MSSGAPAAPVDGGLAEASSVSTEASALPPEVSAVPPEVASCLSSAGAAVLYIFIFFLSGWREAATVPPDEGWPETELAPAARV